MCNLYVALSADYSFYRMRNETVQALPSLIMVALTQMESPKIVSLLVKKKRNAWHPQLNLDSTRQPTILERISQVSKQRIDLNLSLGPIMLPVSIKRQKKSGLLARLWKMGTSLTILSCIKTQHPDIFSSCGILRFWILIFPPQVLKYRILNCKMLTLACK